MQRAFGFAEQGATVVQTHGTFSSNVVQESWPFSCITVYLTGTITLAQIFHDDNAPPTPLANPFHADENGWWWFYAPNGRYDVKITPENISGACEWTIGDIYLGGGTGNVYVGSSPPASPQEGQLWFDSQNVSLNIWYSDAWLQLVPGDGGGGGTANVYLGSAPPTLPEPGQLWFDSQNVSLNIWYSGAWLQLVPGDGGGGSGGTANIYISSSPPSSPEPGQLWFDSQNISLNIWYSGAWLQLVPGDGGGGGGSVTADQVALNPPVGSWSTVQQAISALNGYTCVYVGPLPPASAQPGQLWFDSQNASLNIRFSNTWLQI